MKVHVYCGERYPFYSMWEASEKDVERGEFVDIPEDDWKRFKIVEDHFDESQNHLEELKDKQPSWHFQIVDGVLSRTPQSIKELRRSLMDDLDTIQVKAF